MIESRLSTRIRSLSWTEDSPVQSIEEENETVGENEKGELCGWRTTV